MLAENGRTYDKEYYQNNRAKILARQKEYQRKPEVVKHSREYHRKYMAKFYKENREEWNEYMRKYMAEKRAKERSLFHKIKTGWLKFASP
jgi:predicted metal-dependent phosphoesterase TrpH